MSRLLKSLVFGCICAVHGLAAERIVTFVVEPETVPDGATVYLSGDHPELGNWNAAGLALERKPDGKWVKQATFAEGAHILFKVTLGSWDNEAVNADGAVPENSELDVAGDQTVVIPVAKWKEGERKVSGQVTGTVEYYRNMEYPGLPPRDALVWLPPGYATNESARYPVLYMHDAQQVFDPATSTHGVDWQVDETATRLISEGRMREIIVVATTCTSNRWAEYSDTPEGRLYARFIIEKLKPFIDRTYRTLPDRENTAVMGSSMGGRISFLLAWERPDVFSMAGCFSSAFWGAFTRRVETYDGPDKKLKLYFDNGGIGLERILQPGNDWMVEALQKKGYVLDENLIWFSDPEAEHNEAAWARRAWMPLLFMFGVGDQAWIRELPPPAEPMFAAWDRDPKRAVEMPAFRAAGLRRTLAYKQADAEAASLWKDAMQKLSAGEGTWLSISTVDHEKDEYTSLVGKRVVDSAPVMEGLAQSVVMATTGMAWSAKVRPTDLETIFQYIDDWWLPRAGYEASGPVVIEFTAGKPALDVWNDAEIFVPCKPLP